MVLSKYQVDPDAIAKDNRFADDFKVEIHFKDVCLRCKPERPIKDLCPQCTKLMAQDIKQSWNYINKILDVSIHRTIYRAMISRTTRVGS